MNLYRIMLFLWQTYALAIAVWSRIISRLDSSLKDNVDYVNPMIGNGGDDANGSGGMSPTVGRPFGMTRWVAQTDENYVSVLAYNHTRNTIHGFQGTHQPAIWMGESGQVVIVPGTGALRTSFDERGLYFNKNTESSKPNIYYVTLNTEDGGHIHTKMTASSRVGFFRFTFTDTEEPWILLEATRLTTLGSPASPGPSSDFAPNGTIEISHQASEISGKNEERQDMIIGPNAAPGWAGYFVAQFDTPFESYGTVRNNTINDGGINESGQILSGYAKFPKGTKVINVRIGTSFISADQARANIQSEIPDGDSLEKIASVTRQQWAEKLNLIKIEGATDANLTTFYTGFFHALQYPYEVDEQGRYYSGYDNQVHTGVSYSGYSIWDTFRAAWAWQILFAPERIADMVTSMLNDYKEGGWLPMWKNIVETNIMVGTHADSLVTEAVVKGFGGNFNLSLAYEAVRKDATVPPVNDWTTQYSDREVGVGYEVRAGLTSVYEEKGYVADDLHSEATSRTLDYAYDDHAACIFATIMGIESDTSLFCARAQYAPTTVYNNETGFVEARFLNGSWAGPTAGFTEGDKWAYTFEMFGDVNGLISLKGGNESLVKFLNEHFDEGHNDHTNEPSHHIPYLYSLAGAASGTQYRVRQIAQTDYNDTINGLAGNEDCGQMSAWYTFSALGFYPVNPVSATYVIGAPFFDKATITLPESGKTLVISASGAQSKPYVKSVSLNGKALDQPIITHQQLLNGGLLVFEMAETPQAWGSPTLEQNPGLGFGYDIPLTLRKREEL